MKLNLLNDRLEYSREEMMEVMNCVKSCVATLEVVRLAGVHDHANLERVDHVLNKLVCQIPQKLSVS